MEKTCTTCKYYQIIHNPYALSGFSKEYCNKHDDNLQFLENKPCEHYHKPTLTDETITEIIEIHKDNIDTLKQIIDGNKELTDEQLDTLLYHTRKIDTTLSRLENN